MQVTETTVYDSIPRIHNLIKGIKPLVVAVEGVAGAGKSTLVSDLEKLYPEIIKRKILGDPKRVPRFDFFVDKNHEKVVDQQSLDLLDADLVGVIKRPLAGGVARWLLSNRLVAQDALVNHGSSGIVNNIIDDALFEEAIAVQNLIDNLSPRLILTLIDRHWLTRCVNQHPYQYEQSLAMSMDRLKEPDFWIIMSADVRLIQERVDKRAIRSSVNPTERETLDDSSNNHIPFITGGRMAVFELCADKLKSPVIKIHSHKNGRFTITYPDGEQYQVDMFEIGTVSEKIAHWLACRAL